jgi:hypothetical protein
MINKNPARRSGHYPGGIMTKSTQYRGTVTDRMDGTQWQTRKYPTWAQAQVAAERLCSRKTCGDRGNISTDAV